MPSPAVSRGLIKEVRMSTASKPPPQDTVPDRSPSFGDLMAPAQTRRAGWRAFPST
jgi:hypothetical protein